MDKELLRVVIIATGLFVILIMLAWHYFKNRKSPEESDFLFEQNFVDDIDESLIVHNENDDFDIVPIKPKSTAAVEPEQEHDELFFADEAFTDSFHYEPADIEQEEAEHEEPTPRFVAPEIIQFSIVAKHEHGFNGADLINAFRIAHLHYGAMQIFERLNAQNQMLYGVACMVEPGTFPNTDLEDFYCPGIVFFMQPGLLDEPLSVFDDLLEAIHIVATQLDGDILDHARKPLNNHTIQLIRQSL
ncbi:cell division protein ZipA C-terminal FtsZ-binding domain-containing protein [Methylocucumis oryzae]|uniref:Cell division protein ZipA n=1 Tax=Methylocucumis oryzae TaxID=1632867 RepID=A0A0F3IMN3_9GAMM|nr:cell division protein ZipA C-terminal FtsZ-binding domain-containing protein [Methylocucumis oryzae]KJV07788.1 hypothetical protein VZ94_02405 [Methylocucumis oryzae]